MNRFLCQDSSFSISIFQYLSPVATSCIPEYLWEMSSSRAVFVIVVDWWQSMLLYRRSHILQPKGNWTKTPCQHPNLSSFTCNDVSAVLAFTYMLFRVPNSMRASARLKYLFNALVQRCSAVGEKEKETKRCTYHVKFIAIAWV